MEGHRTTELIPPIKHQSELYIPDTPNTTPGALVTGAKYDTDKLRYDLLPPIPLEEVVNVYTPGAKKYSDRNWEKGILYGRIFAAMMRHAWDWWRGEQRHERGMHHLASVAWCALALMQYEITYPEMDDRPN